MTIKDLVKEYNELFEGNPWYGVSILKTLQSIPLDTVNYKPNQASHSIAELVKHLLVWRKFVVEKMRENKGFDIELNSTIDWQKKVFIHDEFQWNILLGEVIKSQKEITQLLQEKNPEWLNDITPGKNYTNSHMLRGIMYHDLYHLGQIRLILQMGTKEYSFFTAEAKAQS